MPTLTPSVFLVLKVAQKKNSTNGVHEFLSRPIARRMPGALPSDVLRRCDPVESKCFRVEVLSSRKLLGGLEYLSYIAISVSLYFRLG